METFKTTRLDVTISNDELAKCTDSQSLKVYLDQVVGPGIFTWFTSQPKGWEVGGSCSSDRGCEVHAGGSIRF